MKKQVRTVVLSGILCLSVIGVLLVCKVTAYQKNSADYIFLKNGWKITADGIQYENVDLNELKLQQQNKGDEVRMSLVLPEKLMLNPELRIYTVHTDIQVWIDGEEIYSYGQKLRENGKMVGLGYHFIELSESYAGKKLEILMHVTENNAFTSFEVPVICNAHEALQDFIMENKLPLAVNLFLIVFGVCVLVVSLIFAIKNNEFGKLSCIALFSIGIGLWSLCNYNLITIFTYNVLVKAYVEYISLYASTLFVILYFKEDMKLRRKRKLRIMYTLLLACQTVFTLVAVIFQITNVCHFPAVLKYQHVILFVFVLYSLISMIYDIRTGQIRNKATLIGMLIMIGIGLCDMIRFNLQKYITAFQGGMFISWLCIGALIFVILAMVDFCLGITQVLRKTERVRTLEKMAYIDVLTEIANRRKVELEWDRLDGEGKKYGMISFDLNNLKRTNDTKGHDAGDFLIKKFAESLSAVFEPYGMVGRMGGDEFIVVLPDMTNVDIDKLMGKFWKQLEKMNQEHPELNMSAAYGFCKKGENATQTAREIYREADARMYEKKIQMKCSRSSIRRD